MRSKLREISGSSLMLSWESVIARIIHPKIILIADASEYVLICLIQEKNCIYSA